jgi:hypothetical protein
VSLSKLHKIFVNNIRNKLYIEFYVDLGSCYDCKKVGALQVEYKRNNESPAVSVLPTGYNYNASASMQDIIQLWAMSHIIDR